MRGIKIVYPQKSTKEYFTRGGVKRMKSMSIVIASIKYYKEQSNPLSYLNTEMPLGMGRKGDALPPGDKFYFWKCIIYNLPQKMMDVKSKKAPIVGYMGYVPAN